MVGLHAVVVYADQTGTGTPVDLSCLVTTVTIRHGRDDTSGQPEASSATIDLDLRADPLPPAVEVGSLVKVTTTTGTGASTRFYGRVTDLALGWDDAGENTPDAGIGQLTAIGLLADLGRRVVGDTPFPQELDGDRVARIMSLVGITLDPAFSDPGTVQILARDIDSQPALAVAHDAAESATGVLWQTRAGEIRYADAEHRRNAAAALTLDACDILVTPTWQRNLEGLVNKVSLGYGPEPEGGEQPRYVTQNDTSIAQFGTYFHTAETELADLADATAQAQLLMVRNSQPVWVMGALPVNIPGLDAATYDQILALDMHSLVNLTGLPAIGSAPTSAAVWVEGYAETLGYGTHDLDLIVSGYCRTVPPPRWDDLLPAVTWDTATGTWDEATCMGPPVDTGRWDDIPATLRWDQVADTVSWDSWTSTPTAAAVAQPIGA